MSSNPFDQLGLKKKLVEYLLGKGELEGFLKSYVRMAQPFVHPDRAGENDIAKLPRKTVNATILISFFIFFS